jgi:membrane-associated phospholipid phosphatase
LVLILVVPGNGIRFYTVGNSRLQGLAFCPIMRRVQEITGTDKEAQGATSHMQRNLSRVIAGAVCVLWMMVGPAGLLLGMAQTTEPATSGATLGDFPGDLWDDTLALPTTDNLWWLLGGATLAVTVYQFEDPESTSDALDQGVIDAVADFGNIWGDIRVQAPLALTTWGLGSAIDDKEIAGLGYDMSRGLLLTYGVTSLLKVSFQRTRPNGEDYSFPSGHTASAFTTAGVVSRRYGGWAGGIAIGLGVAAGLGRMEDMKHYASDVIAGATIGWIIGRNAGRPKQTTGVSWQLVPLGQGVALAGRF